MRDASSGDKTIRRENTAQLVSSARVWGLFIEKIPHSATYSRHTVAQLLEEPRYKPKSRGFDSRWCHCNFSLTQSFGRTMALGLTQSLTEMSTRNIFCGVKPAGAWGWQPYHLNVLVVSESGSLNLLEPSGPVQACTRIVLPFTHTKYSIHMYFIVVCCKWTYTFLLNAVPNINNVHWNLASVYTVLLGENNCRNT